MATVEVHYLLSEAGRQASLIAGGDGRREQVIAVNDADEATIRMASIDAHGRAIVRIGNPLNGESRRREWEEPMTAAALIAWEMERRAAHARLREERRDAAIGAYLALEPDARVEYDRELQAWRAVPVGDGCEEDVRVMAAYRDAVETARRVNENDERHREAGRRAREIDDRLRRRLALDELFTWVRDRGSPRLKKLFAAGYSESANRLYLAERLAAERPGWSYDSRHAEEVIEPTDEMLDALLCAKASDPEVELRARADHATDCRVRGPRCHCGAAREPILVSKFLGRTIVRDVASVTG